MKLFPSIWTGYYHRLSPEETVLSLKKGGFSFAELCYEDGNTLLAREGREETVGLSFRSFLADQGFAMLQGHLDFSGEITSPEFMDHLKRSIVLYQAVGIQNGVIHLNGEKSEENLDKRREKNLQALRILQEFVSGTSFTLCLENLNSTPIVRSVHSIVKIIRELGEKNLGICLDTGHLHQSRCQGFLSETQEEFIRAAGKYLKALHINGNDGLSDQHLAPFAIRKSVDYKEVLRALREICYEGSFNLEVPGERSGNVPRSVLDLKLLYLKDLLDLMLSSDF